MTRFVLVLFVGLSAVLLRADDPIPDEDGELRATHREVDPIEFELGPAGKLETIAMDRRGRLLAGVSWAKEGAANAERPPRRPPGRPPGRRPPGFGPTGPREYAVKVVDPVNGRVTATWPVEIAPKMLHGCADGTTFVGTDGACRLLDGNGKVTKSLAFADLLDGRYEDAHCSGITANEKYFFVAFGYGFSLRATEDVVRLDRDLTNPRILVEKQYGCCAHLDVDVRGDELLVAENSRHRVNRYSFEGEKLGTWGRRDRTGIEGFAACCNPVNFDFGPGGVLFTAESGVGRVKMYEPGGKYLGFVGWVDTTKFDRGSRLAAMSCYIPIEVAEDGKRIYVMDVRANFVRVLERRND